MSWTHPLAATILNAALVPEATRMAKGTRLYVRYERQLCIIVVACFAHKTSSWVFILHRKKFYQASSATSDYYTRYFMISRLISSATCTFWLFHRFWQTSDRVAGYSFFTGRNDNTHNYIKHHLSCRIIPGTCRYHAKSRQLNVPFDYQYTGFFFQNSGI